MKWPVETYRGAVYPWQMDHMGHMNVRWYTDCFDQATWHLFAAVGITPTYLRQQNKAMAALDQHTLYKAEVVAGELLVMRSEVLEVKDKVLHYRHVLYNAETNKACACLINGVQHAVSNIVIQIRRNHALTE